MKDLVGRIKDREDRDQASKASKLTSKFKTESYFSGEKVDGSKVDTKAKINSTTSEYDKKKRRYGGWSLTPSERSLQASVGPLFLVLNTFYLWRTFISLPGHLRVV